MNFYTYMYLDTRKPGVYQYGEYSFNYEPIYIGKGYGRRWKEHWNYQKNWLGHKIRFIRECGLEPKVIFLEKELNEKSAFQLEIKMIKIIGRADLRKGPLVNLTNGGDGLWGLSEETKKKIVETKRKNNKWSNI